MRGSSRDTLCKGCEAKNLWPWELPVQLASGGNDARGESIALQVGLQDAHIHARHLVLLLQACAACRRSSQQLLSIWCPKRCFLAVNQMI